METKTPLNPTIKIDILCTKQISTVPENIHLDNIKCYVNLEDDKSTPQKDYIVDVIVPIAVKLNNFTPEKYPNATPIIKNVYLAYAGITPPLETELNPETNCFYFKIITSPDINSGFVYHKIRFRFTLSEECSIANAILVEPAFKGDATINPETTRGTVTAPQNGSGKDVS